MRHPITIEPGTDPSAWGVVAPDLPGCSAAGATMENPPIQAEPAVTARIDARPHAGQPVPMRDAGAARSGFMPRRAIEGRAPIVQA